MSSDRFSFLEFGDDEAVPPAEDAARSGEPAQREIGADLLPDGTTLAQVRITEIRGFQSEADEDDGTLTLSSLAGQAAPSVPNRLRIVEVLGERGTQAGQFQYPTGLAVDSNGILFVADSYAHRLQRITPNGGVSIIGGRGSGRAQFLSPQGVATDDEGSFYVVEQGNCRVQKFTHDGILSLVFGRAGKDPGEFSGPTAITVAPDNGDIYVADTGGSRIQRFSFEGRFLNVLGQAGPGLSSPQAVAAAQGGAIYVAETFAQRIVRFDPLGRLDRQIGGTKSRRYGAAPPVPLNQPRALALDPAGLLYVADAGDPDLVTGETRGRLQCLSLTEDRPVIATIEKIGRSLGSLLRPGGLAVGPPSERPVPGRISWGDIYVADTLNHRVLRFAWSGAA